MSEEEDERKELLKKVIESKGSRQGKKREHEVRYMFWMDKDLMKKLKLKAVEQETSVKDLIEEAIRFHFKEFG